MIKACSSDPGSRKLASRKLSHLEKELSSVSEVVASLSADPSDVCVLHQYQEQLHDIKRELGDICNCLISLDLDEFDDLVTLQEHSKKQLFACSLAIKKLLFPTARPTDSVTPLTSDSTGVKLPKLDVPKFDGNILNWRVFWEQFEVSIHCRANLSDSEKLVYLQHSIKDGSARSVIEGLSQSGEYYTEAVESLKARYDRPRLIHQTHMRMILEAPALKDGNGKELRYLHDTVQQHLRALKAMSYEPSSPFITSVLELKLDMNTTFEWQKYSQDVTEVPHYLKLLEFINLRAQASEASIVGHRKPSRSDDHHMKRVNRDIKPIASFAASTFIPASSDCLFCKADKHPLYGCDKFKALSHENMIFTLKKHALCMNCFRPGHFVKQCKSLHRCKKCHKPHHT
jgi:hypothetical protein